MKTFYKLGLKIRKLGIGDGLKKILPKFLYNFIGYIYTCVLFFLGGYKKLVSKNVKLKGLGRGKRAFVLATGPSIKKENLKLLENEDCFSVSNFFLHDDINVINPQFHFFLPYHKPLILENYIEWLKLCDKTLPKETKIILGQETKPHVDKYKLFQNREIYYIFLSGVAYKNNYNLTQPILYPRTGPQMIIPALIYMGYSKIYLLGCDHNTLKTYGEERNDFYDRKKDVRKNAADKDSWGDIIDTLNRNLGMFKHYKYLKNLSEKNHVEIINLSQNSWLNYFKKDSLDNVINK